MTSAQRRTDAARMLPSIVGAFVITIALTACTQLDTGEPIAIPEVTLEPLASPSPTEEPATPESIIETYAVGEVMTEEDALMLRRDFQNPFGAYQMNDGTWRLIDKAAPLPEEIMTEVVSTFSDAAQAARDSSAPGSGAIGGVMIDLMGKFQANSGKRVIPVFSRQTFDDSGENVITAWTWVNLQGTAGGGKQPDQASAIADAEAYIAEQEWAPGTYEIIVTQP